MGELNLIQVCDHTVSTVINDTADLVVTRSDSPIDNLAVDGNPIKILQVVDSLSTVISSDIYNLYGRQVIWASTGATSGQYRVPAAGEEYTISISYSKVTAQSFTVNTCPKCGGHLWYVDVSNVDGMRALTGTASIAQKFLKCLLTQVGTDILYPEYGTNLMDSLGADVASPAVQDGVASAVRSAERQIIKYQETYSEGDKLETAVLDQLIYDEDGPGFYISVSLTTTSGKSAKLNFVV